MTGPSGPDNASGEVGRVVTPGYGTPKREPQPQRVEKPAPKTAPAKPPRTHKK